MRWLILSALLQIAATMQAQEGLESFLEGLSKNEKYLISAHEGALNIPFNLDSSKTWNLKLFKDSLESAVGLHPDSSLRCKQAKISDTLLKNEDLTTVNWVIENGSPHSPFAIRIEMFKEAEHLYFNIMTGCGSLAGLKLRGNTAGQVFIHTQFVPKDSVHYFLERFYQRSIAREVLNISTPATELGWVSHLQDLDDEPLIFPVTLEIMDTPMAVREEVVASTLRVYLQMAERISQAQYSKKTDQLSEAQLRELKHQFPLKVRIQLHDPVIEIAPPPDNVIEMDR